MTLTLEFQRTGVVPSTADGPVRMRGPSLTIGRGPANDIVLPDPGRMISKNHCVIEDRGGGYVIIDLSTNGTFLNYSKQPIGNTARPLNDGDTIALGGYELLVSIGAAAATNPARVDFDIPPPLDEPAPPRVAQGGARAALDDDDFLDEFLGTAPSPKAADRLIPDDPFDAGAAPSGGKGYIPDDFDIQLDSTASNERHHRSGAADSFTPRAANQPRIPDDPDDLDDLLPGLGTVAPDPVPDTAPPPPAMMRAAPPPTEPAAPAQPPVSSGPDAATRAFLKAAGVEHLNLSDAELVETMSRLGATFQTMITGMRELLMTRTALKNEFRMERTTIGAAHNNPLKFSVSPEQALEVMVKPPPKGYLESAAAAREALNDIKAHEVAMLTGMESALKDILKRLDPKALEGRLVTSGGLGSLLKGRKAQYWEVYEKLYTEIAEQAEEDFQEIFGKAFAEAYQDQIRKL